MLQDINENVIDFQRKINQKSLNESLKHQNQRERIKKEKQAIEKENVSIEIEKEEIEKLQHAESEKDEIYENIRNDRESKDVTVIDDEYDDIHRHQPNSAKKNNRYSSEIIIITLYLSTKMSAAAIIHGTLKIFMKYMQKLIKTIKFHYQKQPIFG